MLVTGGGDEMGAIIGFLVAPKIFITRGLTFH